MFNQEKTDSILWSPVTNTDILISEFFATALEPFFYMVGLLTIASGAIFGILLCGMVFKLLGSGFDVLAGLSVTSGFFIFFFIPLIFLWVAGELLIAILSTRMSSIGAFSLGAFMTLAFAVVVNLAGILLVFTVNGIRDPVWAPGLGYAHEGFVYLLSLLAILALVRMGSIAVGKARQRQ
jgi:hypothetical protein